jgi:hypothetical protein
VYFDVRALEDYWFYRVPRDWRAPAMIALIVFIVPTNVLVLGIPLVGAVASTESGLETGMLLESDYWDAFEWLNDTGEKDQVVLASRNVSLWVPAYTDQVVVYGHIYETVPNEEREDQMEAWYHGEDCETLLSDDLPFRVRYIFWGPQEQDMSEDDDGNTYPNTGQCFEEIPDDRIEQEVIKGDVTLYVLD